MKNLVRSTFVFPDGHSVIGDWAEESDLNTVMAPLAQNGGGTNGFFLIWERRKVKQPSEAA